MFSLITQTCGSSTASHFPDSISGSIGWMNLDCFMTISGKELEVGLTSYKKESDIK